MGSEHHELGNREIMKIRILMAIKSKKWVRRPGHMRRNNRSTAKISDNAEILEDKRDG